MEKKSNDLNQKKGTKINLSKKTKITIIIIAVIVLLAAIIIPVSIIMINKTNTLALKFGDFNQATDFYIWVYWNPNKKANGYFYKYVYGNPNDEKAVFSDECYTQNTSTAFERHKGTVGFCIKADIPGEVTEYSDWITMEVDSWVLDAPVVTITDDLQLGWNNTTFKYNDTTENVILYKFNIAIDDEWINEDVSYNGNSYDLYDIIIGESDPLNGLLVTKSEKFQNYILEKAEWQDIEIKVRVKAIVEKPGILYPSNAYKKLADIYEDSDYAYQTLILTEDLYQELKTRSY